MNSAPNLTERLLKDAEFISDLARYAENLLTEKFIRRKYGNLDDATWTHLAESDELVSAIEEEKIRRIRNGSSAREQAQILYKDTPSVLGGILNDDGASPRHRIESAREIRQIAANGPEDRTADRFQIIIRSAQRRVQAAHITHTCLETCAFCARARRWSDLFSVLCVHAFYASPLGGSSSTAWPEPLPATVSPGPAWLSQM
jgi:hypothetical protein